jgi:hypothetical protein
VPAFAGSVHHDFTFAFKQHCRRCRGQSVKNQNTASAGSSFCDVISAGAASHGAEKMPFNRSRKTLCARDAAGEFRTSFADPGDEAKIITGEIAIAGGGRGRVCRLGRLLAIECGVLAGIDVCASGGKDGGVIGGRNRPTMFEAAILLDLLKWFEAFGRPWLSSTFRL